jgi:hypothetical protein
VEVLCDYPHTDEAIRIQILGYANMVVHVRLSMFHEHLERKTRGATADRLAFTGIGRAGKEQGCHQYDE